MCSEVKDNRTVTDADAPVLDMAGLSVLNQLLIPKEEEAPTETRPVVDVSPSELFTVCCAVYLLPTTPCPKSLTRLFPHLGDARGR